MATNNEPYQYLGKPRKAIDGLEKVTGHARYTADLQLPGLVHARPLLSPYAHAEIVAIDITAALAAPGVVAVLTAQDLPTRDRVIASRNSAILAKGKVLFRGQPVAVVVAESEATAQDAAELVRVEYRPLPPVVDMMQAVRPDAPEIWPDGLPEEEQDLSTVHANVERQAAAAATKPRNVHEDRHYQRGNVEEGLRQAAVIVEHTYKTPALHQAYLEPHACVADPGPLGRSLTLYTATQATFLVRNEVASLLSLPESKVRVVPMTFGGGFGAKYGIIEPLTAAVAVTVGRPVRLVLTRSEDFVTTTPAHASVIELKMGADAAGRLTAVQARVFMDNGIFSFAIGGIAATLLGGVYRCPNVQIDCYEVNTHKAHSGAYRAPGAPQATFALESTIDELARALDLDPLEFRLRNAAETNDPTGTNSKWPHMGLKKVLAAMQNHPLWQNQEKAPGEGLGLAVGGWPAFMTPAGCVCKVDGDGTITVQVGVVDISGVKSSFVLVAAEILGVSPDQVEIVQGDTQSGPYGPNSGGSQVTYSVAGAVAAAAGEVKRKLLHIAADEFEASVEDIEIVDGQAQVRGVPGRAIPIGRLATIAQEKRGGPGPVVGEGSSAVPKNAPGFVAHLVKVKVDAETGEVRPLHYLAIQDVGFALNPLMVEGQMHGGALQGLGLGLYEAFLYDEDGQLLTGSFMDYTLARAEMAPTIEAVMVENPSPHGPFGARGVGEPPITAGAAALANAIRDAVGLRLTELPLTAERLWRALRG